MLNSPGALGRVKGSLAVLAAIAPLTRPSRSPVVGNYRSDMGSEGFVARTPDTVSKRSYAPPAWWQSMATSCARTPSTVRFVFAVARGLSLSSLVQWHSPAVEAIAVPDHPQSSASR